MSVNNPLDQLATINTESLTAMASIGPQLNGAGSDVREAYDALMKTATMLPGIGPAARAAIGKVAADETLPKEYRIKSVMNQQEAAGVIIDAHRAKAYQDATHLEATLKAATLPRVAMDATTRQLKREEARAVAARNGITGLMQLMGQDPKRDAELLGDFGAAILSPVDHQALKDSAVASYLNRSDGTERQVASAKALRSFYGLKVRGRIAGLYEASRQALK